MAQTRTSIKLPECLFNKLFNTFATWETTKCIIKLFSLVLPYQINQDMWLI
jgi:hypothetical protein